MNEKKKENTKEIFPPVIKKFQRNQIQTQNKDECWSIDPLDLAYQNTTKTISLFLQKLTIILNILGQFLLKINQEKVQQLH